MFSKIRIIFTVFALTLCLHAYAQSSDTNQTKIESEEARLNNLLSEGAQQVKTGHLDKAISNFFDPIIAAYQEKYKNSDVTIYCATTTEESLLYMVEAAVNNDKNGAEVISPVWADAEYLRAYALIELHRIPEAKESLNRAIVLSPENSRYLTELGMIYLQEKNWEKSTEIFQSSAAAAKSYSPHRTHDLGRAWRGLGYAYVELGRLKEAEEIYQQCLELNPLDEKAADELKYIKSSREKLNMSEEPVSI